ncbi:MAG: helix-turn-helix transcriptional regulator [Myxococcales bacterium]|nr:helix-turn-helix transcriptional regulator [Myxococcales bacterium]MDD9969153.1 helix-turn-helix transcriptional regulator [Myxococcales bacterium]
MNIDQKPTAHHTASSSNLSHLNGVLARSYRRGTHLGQHVHAEAQLLFSCQGIMQVSTPKGCWFVPPERAVWLPPRLPHAVDVLADIEMRSLLVPREHFEAHPEAHRLSGEFVVAVGPLLREAILGSFDLSTHPQLRHLLAEVALFQLAEAEDPGTFIPLPRDPRARHVAEQVMSNPAGTQELSELARRAGASARTITRLFPSETGLTFKTWRQRARIMAALSALSEPNSSIKQVAAALGFSSAAAFSHAFRSVLDILPSELARISRAPR